MSTPFIAEIKIISWNFAPKGWAFCNGQFLPINQNQALFSILGTTYGGNGQTTFALPDLRGRAPLHFGDGLTEGERAGEEAHTLNMNEMPLHTHQLTASSSDGDSIDPTGRLLAREVGKTYITALQSPVTLSPESVTSVGGSQPHQNTMPFLTLNLVIALQGIFPSRN